MTIYEGALPEPRDTAAELARPAAMDSSGLESLRRGLIQTNVSPLVARTMVILFLVGLFAVPLMQAVGEWISGRQLQELNLFKPPARAARLLIHGQVRPAAHQIKWWLSTQHLTQYEEQLKESSLLRMRIRPQVQHVLSRYFGVGNSLAVIAHDGWRANGWLYDQLTLDYVAGPGFLGKSVLHHREQRLLDDGEDDAGADPRPAIVQFHRDCQRLGVHLVFVPIPVKPMLQPAEATRRPDFTTATAVPNNPDYAQFLADLRAQGVDVFDPTPPVLRPGEPPRFLAQDTHWTPQWMEQVAKDLAKHVRHHVQFPPSQRNFRVQELRVARVGDIVDTLNLPPHQTLFAPCEVTIHRVLDNATGQPLASNPDADVLVIGDSFSNIYSAPQMGWGDAAGFPYQLARYLERDVEILARNGSAASDLRAELAERSQPLRGKWVVIWQVAMHELTASNWRVIPLP